MREAGLALDADGHEATGDGHMGLLCFQSFGRDRADGVVVLLAQGGDLVELTVSREAAWIAAGGFGKAGAGAEDGDLIQLVLPKGIKVRFEVGFKQVGISLMRERRCW